MEEKHLQRRRWRPFIGQRADICDAECVLQLRLDCQQRLIHGGILDGLCVSRQIADDPGLGRGAENKAGHKRSVFVIIRGTGDTSESVQDLTSAGDCIDEFPAPNLALRDRGKIVPSNNAKVAGTTLQCAPQVWLRGTVCVDDIPGRQDNLPDDSLASSQAQRPPSSERLPQSS